MRYKFNFLADLKTPRLVQASLAAWTLIKNCIQLSPLASSTFDFDNIEPVDATIDFEKHTVLVTFRLKRP